MLRNPFYSGVGLDDDVVPSRTVLAIFNHLGTKRKELRLLPIAHSHDPRENLWNQFNEEWLNLAKVEQPADFGASDNRVKALMK